MCVQPLQKSWKYDRQNQPARMFSTTNDHSRYHVTMRIFYSKIHILWTALIFALQALIGFKAESERCPSRRKTKEGQEDPTNKDLSSWTDPGQDLDRSFVPISIFLADLHAWIQNPCFCEISIGFCITFWKSSKNTLKNSAFLTHNQTFHRNTNIRYTKSLSGDSRITYSPRRPKTIHLRISKHVDQDFPSPA